MQPDSTEQELRNEITLLKESVSDLGIKIENKNARLTSDSAPEDKKDASEAVFELLADYFFDKINFISFPFSESTDTTDTVNYNGLSRLTDTAEGKFLEVGRRSRTRCNFYVNNPAQIDAYILSPVLYDAFTSLNTFSSMDILRSYIGIKINQGVVTVVTKEYLKDEVSYDTDFLFTGSGSTDTIVLDILYNGNTSKVYLDSKFVGNFPTDFGEGKTPTKTYLSLLSPVRSVDGSTVNLTIENFQFIQDRI